MAPSAQKKSPEIRATWHDILDAWTAVELDFQDRTIYGIDLESGILRDRSWRWLQMRILGLISTPSSRLHRVLTTSTESVTERGADSSHST
jgi:hypothetical protein